MSALNDWGRRMLALLFPYRCVACHEIVEPGTYWCPSCLKKNLQVVNHTLSPHDPLDALITLTPYEGVVRSLFHMAKYHHSRRALAALSALAVEGMRMAIKQPFWQFEFAGASLVLIPGDTRRLADRGVDIPHILFTGALPKQPVWQLLIRNRPTEPQYSLGKQERQTNVAHCFSLPPGNAPQGALLLADDIFTTGATLREAARTIKKAGAPTIIGLALAHDNRFSMD